MRRNASIPPDLPGYDFIKVLGSGGFSDVFLYEQRLPRRRVAVKVLLIEQLNESTRAQFVAEANLMAQLSTHPYIVTIYHADVAADARPYFVMEYCSGLSLAERYKHEQFSVEDALRIGVRLAGAIATAHGAGILHRDIKPANVLTNDFGWPALTDFGISSTLDDDLPVHTVTGAPVGRTGSGVTGTSESQAVGMSVPWSPPEMFEDDPKPDARSDVFSLAATIHTLLAGQTPFEIRGRSNGTLDLIGRIERGAVTPIEREDVPRSLTAVLHKGMATRRSDRYASALDFARALQRVELELGYAPTGIEVPNLHLAQQEKPSTAAGDDETRARGVVSIAAQNPAPASALPTSPVARSSDETRIRGAVIIDPEAAGSPARWGLADDGTVLDGTVLRRPAREETVIRARAGVALDPNAESVSSASPESRRRRMLALGISAAAGVVLVGAVVVAVLIGGSQTNNILPTKTPVVDQSEDANVVTGVPAPKVDDVTTAVDGTVVTFTVSNSNPAEGDVYRWARAEMPKQPKLSTSADIVVDGVSPGSMVCIDVYLQRKDGKISEATRACNQ